MRRNCNLELCLFPSTDLEHEHQPIMEESNERQQQQQPQPQPQQQQQQQLTIFYNGRVCVCDVTELKAKAILLLAIREMKDHLRSPVGLGPAPPSLPPFQLDSPMDQSMKRSLQSFLQKRKHRIQATSPYEVNR